MRIFWRVLAALVLIAAIIGIGVYAYNIGMTQGLAQKVQLPAGGSAPVPSLYYYGHPFLGMGWGVFGCLIPFFLLCLAFGSLRAIFWHGPMGWRHMPHRYWGCRDENGKDLPPFFAEWHRRAHGDSSEPDAKK